VLAVATAALVVALLSACGSSGGASSNSSSGSGGGQSGGGSKKLVIGDWGGIIDKTTKAAYTDPFAKETGISSTFVDAPGTQLAGLQAQAKAGKIQWDVLDSVDGGSGFTLFSKGLLAPLPADLKSKLVSDFGADKVTDFGFAHGSIANVIVCNMDKMKTCPTSMAEFFDTQKFPQPRMFGGIEPIEAITAAQVASGVPAAQTATTDVDMDAAFAKLKALKPKVKAFWQSGDQQQQIMRGGEVSMGIMWCDRAAELNAEGMHLKIVWPGAAYEPSYWTAVKGAPNEAGALKLLGWIADHPEAQAQWGKTVHDSVPSPKAIEMVPNSIRLEMSDYEPNFKQLAMPNFEWYTKNGPALDKAYENFLRG
jgi:putative spermidine/putrescine transport system substrate-binding protein